VFLILPKSFWLNAYNSLMKNASSNWVTPNVVLLTLRWITILVSYLLLFGKSLIYHLGLPTLLFRLICACLTLPSAIEPQAEGIHSPCALRRFASSCSVCSGRQVFLAIRITFPSGCTKLGEVIIILFQINTKSFVGNLLLS